jgi:hypothetical protein
VAVSTGSLEGLVPPAGLTTLGMPTVGAPAVGVTVAQGVALFFAGGALALDGNAGASGVVEADAYSGLPFANDLWIGAAALSPDGQQATVAGVRQDGPEQVVRVYDRRGPTDGGNVESWSLQGEFVLTDNLPPIAVAYDASGSQVVVLFGDQLQAGYCSLR